MKKRLISISAAALAFLATAGNALATTLIVYVNPSTWAITTFDGDGTEYVYDRIATYTDQYNNQHHRYYTGGSFDTVVIERNDTGATLQTLSPCNNIFYIDRSAPSAYVCSSGYNGSGNGVNNIVYDARALQNGDLCIGGEFTSAGGYSSTSYFSCYRWTGGWGGVSGIYANNSVYTLSFDAYYRLVVTGAFTTVYGPITSGGAYTSLSTPSNIAYWNEWHYPFTSDYWSAP